MLHASQYLYLILSYYITRRRRTTTITTIFCTTTIINIHPTSSIRCHNFFFLLVLLLLQHIKLSPAYIHHMPSFTFTQHQHLTRVVQQCSIKNDTTHVQPKNNKFQSLRMVLTHCTEGNAAWKLESRKMQAKFSGTRTGEIFSKHLHYLAFRHNEE